MSNRTSALRNVVAGAAVRPVIPSDFDQAVRFAQTAVQAGLFQAESQEKAMAQATMAVLQGLELGIPPMQAVQQIAMIGGRCTIWGDLIPALIWRAGHTIREWVEGEGDARVAWCEITRGDNGEIIKRKFSVEDAKRAGLWDTRPKLKRKDNANTWREEDNDSPWYRYEERMLQMRARGFCARDGVPDALHGLYIREEIEEERLRSDAHDEVVVTDAEASCRRRLRTKTSKRLLRQPSLRDRRPRKGRPKPSGTPMIFFQTSMSASPPAKPKTSSMRSVPKTSKLSAALACSRARRRS